MTKGIDLYTKIILTVIAACLIYVVTKDVKIVPEAKAASSGSVMDVNIVSVAGQEVRWFGRPGWGSGYDKALPVKIMSDK